MNRWLPILLLLALALNLPAAELVAVEKVAAQIAFYTPDGKRIGGFPATPTPHEIIVSPDGKLAYVANNGILWMTDPGEGGNLITIVDLANCSKAGVIDLGEFRRPHGMDIDPATNRMAVTIENPNGLLLIDLASRRVLRKYDVQGDGPHMVVFGPRAEYAYVSNTKTNTLAVVNLASGDAKVIPIGDWPQGGVLSHDGKHIYLTVSHSNRIAIVDTDKREPIGVIETAESPNRIALTPDGKTLVYSLQDGHAVGFADIASKRQTDVVPLSGPPLSLHLSPDGERAYAGVQEQDKIIVVSVAERKIVKTIATPQGAGPDPVIEIP